MLTTILKKSDAKDTQTDSTTESAEANSLQNPNAPDLLEIPRFITSRPEQLIEHCAYTLSYNPNWHIPNWVAYELTRSETHGNNEREDLFEIDPDVKGTCPDYRDYSNSGYDRGHMAPAGDMKWDPTAMKECFYLSNICPKDHNLNKGDWNDLEMKARHWANKYGNVFIVCGPIMSDHPETIGKHDVAVPDAFFKVFLAEINRQWQAIGFIFENKAGHRDLRTYCKSIDEIESTTGIDFFPKLDDDIENTVETQYNTNAWGL